MPIYSTTSFTANLPMSADDGVTSRVYSFVLNDFTHFSSAIPPNGMIRKDPGANDGGAGRSGRNM